MSDPRERVLTDIAYERIRQDGIWGGQNHPDGTGGDAVLVGRPPAQLAAVMRETVQRLAAEGSVTWAHIALEEVFEALAETDPAALRAEIIQAAAVFAAWAEAIDRRARRTLPGCDAARCRYPFGSHAETCVAEPRCVDCGRYPVALAGQVCGECAEAEDCAP